MNKNDIQTKEDIILLVDQFYGKVKTDELLAPIFAHVDWPEHLPTMYNFWASMMLGEQTYRDNPFQKHMALKLKKEHFTRWVQLFTETVNENFTGDKAEEIKMRANSIANIFQYKLGLISNTEK